MRRLREAGCENLLLKTRAEVDLANQQQVRELMLDEKADYVFLAAALVGGIYANNTYPAQFIYSNIMVTCNVIHRINLLYKYFLHCKMQNVHKILWLFANPYRLFFPISNNMLYFQD